jgi:hypothetical protein
VIIARCAYFTGSVIRSNIPGQMSRMGRDVAGGRVVRAHTAAPQRARVLFHPPLQLPHPSRHLQQPSTHHCARNHHSAIAYRHTFFRRLFLRAKFRNADRHSSTHNNHHYALTANDGISIASTTRGGNRVHITTTIPMASTAAPAARKAAGGAPEKRYARHKVSAVSQSRHL